MLGFLPSALGRKWLYAKRAVGVGPRGLYLEAAGSGRGCGGPGGVGGLGDRPLCPRRVHGWLGGPGSGTGVPGGANVLGAQRGVSQAEMNRLKANSSDADKSSKLGVRPAVAIWLVSFHQGLLDCTARCFAFLVDVEVNVGRAVLNCTGIALVLERMRQPPLQAGGLPNIERNPA